VAGSVRRAGAIAIGAALVAIPASVALGQGSGAQMAPRPAEVSANGDTVRARIGSFCVVSNPNPDGTQTVLCADAVPPDHPPAPRLDVGPRDQVTIRFHDNADIEDEIAGVQVGLLKFSDGTSESLSWTGHAKPAARADSFRVRLPADLRGAGAIDIFARYESGDASFTAGIR
jgi:hypothetical protein